jgi:DNA-binding transcriptional ArsR family regulator
MMATLKALAEPNRFHIVELLRDGARPVGYMAHRLRLRQPQVSKHLRVLSDAGLVDARVDAQRRIYALRPAPLQELKAWLERYRSLWEENFQRLDALLDELKTGEQKIKHKKRARTKRYTKR